MPVLSRHPDELYKNGIQRSSFIPAIDLLKTQFNVIDLDSGTGLLLPTFLFQALTSATKIIDVYPVHSRTYIITLSHQRTKQKSTRYLIR